MRRSIVLLATMTLALLLASGVALAVTKTCQANTDCFGTTKGDTLTGSAGNDLIYGLGGPDTIRGKAGDDYLAGGSGDDDIKGNNGNEVRILGGAGDDFLDGGAGMVQIAAGAGNDTVFGGLDNDSILVFGDQVAGFQDDVFCGPGIDSVSADPGDDIHDSVDQFCEQVEIVPVN